MTVNFGDVCSHRHKDPRNPAVGQCGVKSLGDHDHTQGGHMVLWDLKLLIEFPHAATIFIPSAVLFHSNTPVAKGERRVSITQYAAGPIFQWVDNGFCTDKFLKNEQPDEWARLNALKASRWEEGVKLFPTVGSIIDYFDYK